MPAATIGQSGADVFMVAATNMMAAVMGAMQDWLTVIGTPDIQHAVPAALVLNAIYHIGRKVRLGDGIALADVSLSEHNERPPLLQELQLSGYRFEESGRSHNAVAYAALASDKLVLELQLRCLELQ